MPTLHYCDNTTIHFKRTTQTANDRMIKLILVYSWWNSMPPLHENDNYIAKWKMPELSCNVKQKKKKKDSKFCEKLKWTKLKGNILKEKCGWRMAELCF